MPVWKRAEAQTVLRCRTRLMQIDASVLGGSDSNAARFHGHDRTGAQLRAVFREDFNGSRSVTLRGEANETDDAAVRLPTNNCEFSEVLVDRDDDLRTLKGAVENLPVARILWPFSDGFNVMTGSREDLGGASPDARVKEHLHTD